MTGKGGIVIPADFRPHIVIYARGRVYDLGPDAVGEPLGDLFGASCPERMRHWKRYQTKDGPVFARPDEQA